ncbi:MAG: glycoside hydrolase family 2 TIM barrel-domain containing protein [Dysgonomonas sp.]
MQKINFNQGWLFSNMNGTIAPVTVDLPHDAMIHEKRDPECKNANNTAWFPGGRYLYEKQFDVPKDYKDKFIAFEFEGIYRNAEIILNGKSIAKQKYGYTGFYVTLDDLYYGHSNTIQVKVDNSEEPNSRWYSGSGIYREVHMLVADKEHIELDGVKIHTISINPTVIEVCSRAGNGQISVEVLDEAGLIVATSSGEKARLKIPNAKLWSENTPYLYTAKVTLHNGDKAIDSNSIRFGIREITWNSKAGLCINGRETKLRGSCIHHDNGILGACAFREAEYRKIRILKEAGFNAIRSSHNPCSKAMLDACDEYGMYVMDESFDQWFIPKTRFDYAREFNACYKDDLKAMVDKDYNHPSVIMYSIGNEVSETQQQRGIELTRDMTAYLKSLDKTRPVTCGINLFLNALISKGFGIYKEDGDNITEKVSSDNKGKASKLAGSAFYNYLMEHLSVIKGVISKAKSADKSTKDAFGYLDICGYNYGSARYIMDGKKYPERVIVGSETYIPDLYDNWNKVINNPHLIGDFMWVSWDYLGEAGIGAWSYGESGGYFSTYPTLLASSGVIDITGHFTPALYYAQEVYGVSTTPHIGVRPVTHSGDKPKKSPWRNTDAVESWSWLGCEGRQAEVEVYTNAHSVCLTLNNKVIRKAKPKKCIARFKLPYEPGTLTATVFDNQGNSLGKATLETAGQESLLQMVSEKHSITANGQDLCYLNLQITDKNNVIKVLEEKDITLTVKGPGVLQGFGSANPCTEEVFSSCTHTTYYGRAQAIIRSSGEVGTIEVVAACDGMESASILISAL